MLIADREYGGFSVCLIDDGTMDTVIEIYMVDAENETKQEIRYTFTDGEYRDEDGAMTDEGFQELAAEALEIYIETYLI